MKNLPLNQIICGDCLEVLKDIPNESINLVITSPPYYKQRDYGKGIGNEEKLEEYIENLYEVFLLQILNDVEKNKAPPKTYLTALFILLIQKAPAIREAIKAEFPTLPIDLIVECLSSHFFQKYSVGGTASLPVIAIYSIYEILMKDVSRYQDKTLRPLRSLYSPDLRVGLGDIEILDESNEYFECVEIKHEIPIEAIMIEDAYEKFKNTSVKRYFLLSTAKPFIKSGEEEKIKDSIEKVKEEHGCEVIVNGIIPSLKYYLRLLANPGEFMSGYTNNLISRFSETAEIKEEHMTAWKIICEEKSLPSFG